MASKRKRDTEEETLGTPNQKISKQEEVTRSGRVRKKPAKFVDVTSEDMEASKTETGPKVITTPKTKLAMLPALSPVPVVTPQPVAKIITVTDPIKIEEEMFQGEVKSEDDTHSAARSGRARKKSAKVLEMEEFEEAEKKQTTKKDAGKRVKSPTSPGPGMKSFPKSPTSAMPTTVAKLLTSPVSSMKIKDIQPAVKVETFTPSSISTSPLKISPVGSSPNSPITSATLSPPSGGKGSVIKLLLSSPAQPSHPILSSGTVTQASPPLEKSTKKKSKTKEKSSIAEDHTKLKQALQMTQHSSSGLSPVKQELTVETGVLKGDVVGKLNLKLKLAQLKKDDVSAGTSGVKTAASVSGMPKSAQKETKTKKGKKSSVKDESVFLPPPLPSPNVIHVGPMSMGLEMKSESDHTPKKKAKAKADQEKQKARDKMDMEEAMMGHEFGLDMSDMNLAEPGEDSFMDIDDDDDGLIIPEDEPDVKLKLSKKKKTGKSKGTGKMAQAAEFGDIPADSDLVMDFSRMKSDDKKKKKALKEVPEESEKLQSLSKKKRAPTAYMLWCNEHRPKVVMENPGIDFSSISKTLGEMWSSLPEKEKLAWKRKAKKAAGKGSTLITTGKAGVQKVAVSQAMAIAKQGTVIMQKPALTAAALLSAKNAKQTVEDLTMPVKGFGIDPVDVAAHLKIVGESLSIIGMRLQEHRRLYMKRPPTAYMMFCKALRQKVVMENPGISFGDISKKLGKMWTSLTGKKKVKRLPKKKRKKKYAPCAYTLWFKEQRSKLMMEYPYIRYARATKMLRNMWSSLPEEEKLDLRQKVKNSNKERLTLNTMVKTEVLATAVSQDTALQGTDIMQTPMVKIEVLETAVSQDMAMQDTDIMQTPMVKTEVLETAVSQDMAMQGTDFMQTPMVKTEVLETAVFHDMAMQGTDIMQTPMVKTEILETAMSQDMYMQGTDIMQTPMVKTEVQETAVSQDIAVQGTNIMQTPMVKTEILETAVSQDVYMQGTDFMQTPMVKTEVLETALSQDMAMQGTDIMQTPMVKTEVLETALSQDMAMQGTDIMQTPMVKTEVLETALSQDMAMQGTDIIQTPVPTTPALSAKPTVEDLIVTIKVENVSESLEWDYKS